MGYIVVRKYDMSKDICLCDVISDDLMTITSQFTLPKTVLGNYVKEAKLIPLNFSIDRRNAVVEDCGSFSRFSSPECAVVIAELKTQSGRNMGYRLLGCANGVLSNMKVADILSLSSKVDYPILQNAIIRNNTVNCYKLRQFPTITIGVPSQKKSAKASASRQKTTGKTKKATVKEFTEEQLKELERCRKSGISSRFIENPDLTPEQMRVLWVSASKGALAYLYCSPVYSREVMVFYADRLVDTKIANDCVPMLSRPELPLDKLAELYLCVCQGVDYSDLMDKSATEIMVARREREKSLWGSSVFGSVDANLMDKAIAYAQRVRGI